MHKSVNCSLVSPLNNRRDSNLWSVFETLMKANSKSYMKVTELCRLKNITTNPSKNKQTIPVINCFKVFSLNFMNYN